MRFQRRVPAAWISICSLPGLELFVQGGKIWIRFWQLSCQNPDLFRGLGSLILIQQQLGQYKPGCCHFGGCAEGFVEGSDGVRDLSGLQLAAGQIVPCASEVGFLLQGQ